MYWVLLNLNYVSFHFGIQNYNFLHKGYGISVTLVTRAEIHISYFVFNKTRQTFYYSCVFYKCCRNGNSDDCLSSC